MGMGGMGMGIGIGMEGVLAWKGGGSIDFWESHLHLVGLDIH